MRDLNLIDKISKLNDKRTKLLESLDASLGLQKIFGKELWAKGSVSTGATRQRSHNNFYEQWTVSIKQGNDIVYKGTLNQMLRKKPDLYSWVIKNYHPITEAYNKLPQYKKVTP